MNKRKNDFMRIKEAMILDCYKKYHSVVNMSFRELLRWARNPCSRMGSLSRRPIKHNLELLKTPKHKWNLKHFRWANKTIAFVSRMKKVSSGKVVSDSCPFSKRDIALKNWGFDASKSLGGKKRNKRRGKKLWEW